jgi:hypothetical protein
MLLEVLTEHNKQMEKLIPNEEYEGTLTHFGIRKRHVKKVQILNRLFDISAFFRK